MLTSKRRLFQVTGTAFHMPQPGRMTCRAWETRGRSWSWSVVGEEGEG